MSNNIVKHEQLKDIAQDLWNKAKARDIEAIAYEAATKKIKATNAQTPALELEAELTNLVSIDERAEFKKDVSVDGAKTISNSNIGNINGPVAAGNRTTGYRGLTSKQFTDGYVKLLRIYLPSSASGTINAHVWMIKKGALKTEDKFLEKITKIATVLTSGTNKYIDVEIERKFEEETFFVLRTEGSQQIQGINNIKPEFTNDIINVNDSFNPSSTTENINWNGFAPRTDLVGYMELHGRTGIVDISKRLEEINLASGNYVLQSDTTDTGGTGQQGRVVKLGADGKLHTNMLPELAINRVLMATSKNEALNMRGPNENQLQLGDVVVITGEQNKVYMCKDGTHATFENAFIELSLGDGTVKTVAGGSPNAQGNIQVTVAEEGTEGIKVTFGSSGGTPVKIATYMTQAEVDEIKRSFT